MRKRDMSFRIDRLGIAGLTLLLVFAFAFPAFSAMDESGELPENILAEEEDSEKFEIECEDDEGLDRETAESSVRARSTSLLAHACLERDRRFLRRMCPRAPPIG